MSREEDVHLWDRALTDEEVARIARGEDAHAVAPGCVLHGEVL